METKVTSIKLSFKEVFILTFKFMAASAIISFVVLLLLMLIGVH